MRPLPVAMNSDFTLSTLIELGGRAYRLELRRFVMANYPGLTASQLQNVIGNLGKLTAAQYVDSRYDHKKKDVLFWIRDEVKPIIAACDSLKAS